MKTKIEELKELHQNAIDDLNDAEEAIRLIVLLKSNNVPSPEREKAAEVLFKAIADNYTKSVQLIVAMGFPKNVSMTIIGA